jgi:RNA polymerase nonessential primary-like sigma factor
VARLLDKPVAEIRHVLRLNERTASLDAPLDIDHDLSVADAIADDQSADPAQQLEQVEIELHVADWVAQLSDKQRYVVELRYGLNGNEVSTLEKLADELGVTRERVRQIQIEALAQLRRRLARDGVRRDAVL